MTIAVDLGRKAIKQTNKHFARIQKVLPGGSDFGNVFLFVVFFLVDEGRDCRTNDGPTFNAGLVTL